MLKMVDDEKRFVIVESPPKPFPIPKEFFEAKLPMSSQEPTVFIGLATPEANDFLNQKFSAAIRIGTPCEKCLKKKTICIHGANATPALIAAKKRERYQRFYQTGSFEFEKVD
jgi:hypothetical protein